MTLAEIILVIAVGMVMLASGTMMYQQARQSAGASKARDKVASMQQMVETMATQAGGTLPTLDQVAQVWAEKRPQDYNTSPWGGQIDAVGWSTKAFPTVPTAKPNFDYKGISGGAGDAQTYPVGHRDLQPDKYTTNHPAANLIYKAQKGMEGQIDYWRLSSGAATASFFEQTINQMVTVRAYAISIHEPNFRPSYFTGGAPLPER
jgi:type II secretory pathway pseudopilin PulG